MNLKKFKKMTRFPVFGHNFPVLEHPFLLYPVLSRVPSRILAVPARPFTWQDFQLVPLSLCPGTMKELLSHCPKKLHCPVPLETLVSIAILSITIWVILKEFYLKNGQTRIGNMKIDLGGNSPVFERE